MSAAVADSKMASMPRARSHTAISTRWGTAARRCDLATMPAREMALMRAVIQPQKTSEDQMQPRNHEDTKSIYFGFVFSRLRLESGAHLTTSALLDSQVQKKFL